MTLAMRAIAAPAFIAILAGCAGGGASLTQRDGSAAAASGFVRFTLAVPKAGVGAQGYRRHARDVSPATASVVLTLATVNGAPPATAQPPAVIDILPTSPSCTLIASGDLLSCSVTLSGPAGTDVFTGTAYSDFDGKGAALSSGSATATVVAGQTVTAPLTLNGIIAGVVLSVPATTLPLGFVATFHLFVIATDASGSAIIGSDPYSAPLTFVVHDPSDATTLASTTINGPTSTIAGTYDGTGPGATTATVSISASGAGVPAAAIVPATFTADDERGWTSGAKATFAGTTTSQIVPATGTPPPATTTGTAVTSTIATRASFNGQTGLVDAHQVETDTPSGSSSSTTTTTDYYYAFAGLSSNVATIDFLGSSAVNAYGSTQVITENGTDIYDELPETKGNTWSQPGVYSSIYVAKGADPNPSQTYSASTGSYEYDDTFSNRDSSSATANADGTGSYSYQDSADGQNRTWSIGAVTQVSGSNVIPITETVTAIGGAQTTSTTNVPDWYPGGVFPQPPFSDTFTVAGSVAIPVACDVPAALATTAVETDESYSILDPVIGDILTIARRSFVAAGLGRVCLISSSTEQVYYAIGNAANPALPTGAVFIGTLLYTARTQSVSGMQTYARSGAAPAAVKGSKR